MLSKLNIRSQTMLGTHHSWAITMRNLLLQFRKKGHKLYLDSTNGKDFIPKELYSRLDRKIAIPDIDICYTLPRNFKSRFRLKSKLKLAIYNYETEILPKAWINDIKYIDFALPSSNFSKEVFVRSGWPENKCIVIPHGINLEDFDNDSMYNLSTDKSFKFLNISIPHYRKNIDLLLDTYYSTFSNNDDVCLVLKTSLESPKRKLYSFEINLKETIKSIQKKHIGKVGGLPQVEIVTEKLPTLVPLYKSCDVLVSATSSEGFGLPLLEGLAAGNLVIAPRCTGHLDFLNDKNSLLVDVKQIDAGKKYQYWKPTDGAKTFLPLKEDLAQKMIDSYNNKDDLNKKFKNNRLVTCNNFTWEAAAEKVLDIYENI